MSAQCDAVPLTIDQSLIDISFNSSSSVYCPGNFAVVDISHSGDPISNKWLQSGNITNPACDPTAGIFLGPSFTDTYKPGTCPEIIEREWTVIYDDVNAEKLVFVQYITLVDDELPVIEACPGGGTAIEIKLEYGDDCDENNPMIEVLSGFPYEPSTVEVLPSKFNELGIAKDNCNDGEIFQVEYVDEILGLGCETGMSRVFDMVRHWTVTDLCGNTATCDQEIRLMDLESPIFDLFPNFFYDQGPQGEGSGVWEIESVFCDEQIDFKTDFILPMATAILDNCTSFGGLEIEYSPDIAAGPIDLSEGENVISMKITDACLNSYFEQFIINVVCKPCGNGVIYSDCESPTTMCNLTDILSFSSCTSEYHGDIIDDLCTTGVLNNPSYFEFIAGSEVLDLTIEPFNCVNTLGIQATVTDPCDPTTCYSDSAADCFTSSTTIRASNLTVGNTYQLIVDGCAGDQCGWQITGITATISCEELECPLNPSIEKVDAICLDDNEQLIQLVETEGNLGGKWSGPGMDSSGIFNPTIAGPGTHNIRYEVEDLEADCSASANIDIVVYASPVENFTVSVDTISIGDTLSVSFDNNADKNYHWDFDSGHSDPNVDAADFNLSYSIGGNKKITLEITSGPACDLTITHEVYVRSVLDSVEDVLSSFFIPNIISPFNDQDPINKSLCIFLDGADAMSVNSVVVFDRMGNRVYFNDQERVVYGGEAAILWEPQLNTRADLKAGVYVYLVNMEINGVSKWLSGDITVIR